MIMQRDHHIALSHSRSYLVHASTLQYTGVKSVPSIREAFDHRTLSNFVDTRNRTVYDG